MVKPGPTGEPSSDAASQATFGLEELLAMAQARLGSEVSARTVRLYQTQGLLDKPDRESRSAVYTTRQLNQLLLIRTLAAKGLSLSAIAPLCGQPDKELEAQLSEILGAETPPSVHRQLSGNPALDYLEELREDDARASPGTKENSVLPFLGSSLSSGKASPSQGSRSAANRWNRFNLAPGVELHISDSVSIPPAGSRRFAWLEKLAQRFAEQLDERSNQ
ncbi:MerR family transcriptional regulator [Cyanobium sp. Morenito 9A2]|uniref:MerR family transcriptional regulator n=1 Tax=Cyanobium sp. Morenito 9A2 TaxID=2823718 RepID=UPI0020CF8324|nr:MerR family transcriptional regulator [Cyanobium sp. Morenito 9A2]MCP9851017.1 MerR family transcriptional regulator [Cyanobium sp. Morenito 9A2]